eukprot:TRINITY_DN2159_c0_g1_i4.p1 TRINITY_DN2159_c0_g1~~TRINITY_DN2159_c0_g1_i4.p1  ORF type:complete len:500 (-),score=61.01 TRINITY_DN2159_c0_g1_i4:298-1797(-)
MARDGMDLEAMRSEEMADDLTSEVSESQTSAVSGEDLLPPCESSHANPVRALSLRSGSRGNTMQHEALKPQAAQEAQAPRLEALDAPRWLASSMIITFHFYNPASPTTPITLGRFARCGGLWTQFFFALSGFVLAYVEMARPSSKKGKTLTQLQYLRKRLVTIYPSYMVVLVITLFQDPPTEWFSWAILPLHATLLQAWFPITVGKQCCGQSWVTVAWFMSALVLYWLLLRPLANLIRRASVKTCCVVIALCWIVSLVPGAVWEYQQALFGAYDASFPGATTSTWSHEFLWCFLKNNPIGYLNVFLAGVVAARLFILTCLCDAETREAPLETTERLAICQERAPLVFRFGVVLGYALYAGVVALYPSQSNPVSNSPWYLACHNGGMLPIMILVLMGGALGLDPIAKYIFQCKIFLVLGRISYSQYLLQYNVWALLTRCISDKFTVQIVFPFVLVTFAYVTERFVGRVYTEWQRLRGEKGEKGCDEVLIARCDAIFARRC